METQRDNQIKTTCDRQDADIDIDITGKLFLDLLVLYINVELFIETFPDHGDVSLGDIHNSSITTYEKLIGDNDKCPNTSTQETVTESMF